MAPHEIDHKMETLPRERLLELQSRALREQVTRLARASPFYHRKLGEEPSFDLSDLHSLPLSTRAEVMASQEADPPWGGLLAVPIPSLSIIGFSNAIAAGLPGREPIQLAATAGDMRARVDTATRAFTMGGSTPGGPTAIIGEVARSLLHHVYLGALARTGATPFQTGRGLTLRHVRHTLPALAPTQIVTHPTYALHLARLLEEEDASLPVERLFLWGEMGPSVPEVRRTIRDAWDGADVRDVYAMEELGVLAAECEAADGLHGFEDRFCYEVVDPATGEPMGPGERGELVVTPLETEAMPLLRYRTGDLVMVDDGPCPCGRTHLRLQLMGRVMEGDAGPVVVDLAKALRLMGRLPALAQAYRVVIEGDRGFLEVPLGSIDGDQQTVAINTALLAARSAGLDLRPVIELPPFHHRAVRIVLADQLEWWGSMAEEQGRLEM